MRATYNLKRAAERVEFVLHIRDLAVRLGATAEWDFCPRREPTVYVHTPRLAAMIWTSHHAGAEMPLIHWHDARDPDRLRHLSVAWQDVNEFHRHKATSFPRDYPALFAMLEAGVRASLDGSAFEGYAAP